MVISFQRPEERGRVFGADKEESNRDIMERTFTYYYRAGKLTLRDLDRMKTRMDALFEEFPTADIV